MTSSSSSEPRPIGVFDSGIGGLTVFRELLRHTAGRKLIYFGDTARLPYGTKSGDTVTRFTLEAAEFLLGQNIEALVVACNTASAYAIAALEERHRIPVVGVIEPGARAAIDVMTRGPVAVIGTAATIASGAYERAIHAIAPDVEILTRPCPLFVPLVEEGWIDHPITRRVAEEYLAEFKTHGVDVLILGCTHYPLLKDVIQEVMGPEVRLIDAGEYTARALGDRLAALNPSQGTLEVQHRIFLSDLPRAFRETSERFLGRALPPVEVVERHEERWIRT